MKLRRNYNNKFRSKLKSQKSNYQKTNKEHKRKYHHRRYCKREIIKIRKLKRIENKIKGSKRIRIKRKRRFSKRIIKLSRNKIRRRHRQHLNLALFCLTRRGFQLKKDLQGVDI